MRTEQEILQSDDAMVWAEEFCARVRELPQCDPTDEGWVVGWMANAMAAGERQARRKQDA